MKRVWLAAVLASALGLAVAAGSQAKTSHHRLKCGRGYVRQTVRVLERKHGRIVRRRGKIVYERAPRCVKTHKPTPTPTSTTTTISAPTTTAPSPPPPVPPSCPSAPPGAGETIDGHTYTLEGMDTFTRDAPVGSFAQPSAVGLDANSLPVVYRGDHGMGWTEYADGWPSTKSNGHEGYQPSTVQSVHDGVLDFYLHDDASGYPVGADLSPLPGGNRYQTYGEWSFCERVAPADANDLADFHQAPLLWPQADSDWLKAESDYPEADLNASTTVDALNQWSAYAHYVDAGGQNVQDFYRLAQVEPNFDPTQWHVYTQTWEPGFRSYYVDGLPLGTSSNNVFSLPERWQLQIEPSVTGGAGSGHVYVKWVWIGTY